MLRTVSAMKFRPWFCAFLLALLAAPAFGGSSRNPPAFAPSMTGALEAGPSAARIAAALDTLAIAQRSVTLAAFAGRGDLLNDASGFEIRARRILEQAVRHPERIRGLRWPERTAWLQFSLRSGSPGWSLALVDALGTDLPPRGAPSRGPAALAVALNALRVLDGPLEFRDDPGSGEAGRLAEIARHALLAAASESFPLRDEAFHRLRLWAEADGDTLAARAWADSLVQLTPRSSRTPAARVTRARALLAEGDAAGAVEELHLALPAADSAALRWLLSRALLRMGYRQEAALQVERLIGSFGSDPLAARAFRERLAMSESDPDLYLPAEGRIRLARWVLSQPASGAVEFLLTAAGADALPAQFREEAGLELVRFFYREKRYAEAEPLLHDLLRSATAATRNEARLLLARILRNTGRVPSMETQYRILIQEGGLPGARAAWELGREYESLSRWRDAEAVYSLHLARFPKHSRRRDVFFRRGFVRVRRHRWRRAVRDFRSALRLSRSMPDQEQAAYWLARTLAALGKKREAADAARAGAWRTLPEGYYGVRLREVFGPKSQPAEPPKGLPMRAQDPFVSLLPASEWPASLVEQYHRGLGLARLGVRDAAVAEFSKIAEGARRSKPVMEALTLAAVTYHLYPEAVRWADRTARLLGRDDPLWAGYRRLSYPPAFYAPVTRECARWGVEPALVWGIMRQESLYDPRAVSRAGALGLLQIMPATLGRLVQEGKHVPLAVEALHRPEVNLELGVRFLADRLEEFGGHLLPALASYNAGETKTRQWLQAADGDTEDLFLECIGYPETYRYVRRVLWLQWTYRRYYGLSVPSRETNPPAGRMGG